MNAAEPLPTIDRLLRDSEIVLPGSDTPRLDAEILLAHVMGCNRAMLYARGADTIGTNVHAQYLELLNRRQDGEPIAYITGEREFWSMPFTVNRHTLIPRPETECLVESALAQIPSEVEWLVADLGTGSGAIALAIAHERPACRLIATDNNRNTLAVAEHNRLRHGLDNVDTRLSDWFQALDGLRFDMIISNPPYVAESDPHLEQGDVRFEPAGALAAGDDGLDALRLLIRGSCNYLVNNGHLLLEHGFDQGTPIMALLQEHGFRNIQAVSDLAGHHRATGAQWTSCS